uniref:F-box domain-containing protein n=1 Tax=Dunaliella tertiolecta TaxID=3047 RepID=A0A7S3R0G6_DUNTE|mmetsp:Transcript_18876/g.52858  ORF Transcript_18876/g.52858 Transcript_18876/m.52858 type:complete len:596 (+) Transcript_18876:243-2030(+)
MRTCAAAVMLPTKQIQREDRGPSPDVFPFLSLPLSLCDRIAGGLPTSSRASLTCVCKELYNHLPKALQKWDESTTLRLWAEQTKETTPVQELKQLEECSREVLVQLNIGEKTDDPELYKKVKQLLQQAEEGSKAANVLAGVRALKLEVLPNIDEYAPNDVVELGALLARKLPRLERLELCCLDLNFSSLILRALGPALPCLQELTMSGVRGSRDGAYRERKLQASHPLPSLSLCLAQLQVLRLCVEGSLRLFSMRSIVHMLKNLETLEVYRVPCEDLGSPQPWESLRKLKVGMCSSDSLNDLLAVCPNLDVLEVGYFGKFTASPYAPLLPSTSLRCFKLQEFSLRHLPALVGMHTPRLQQCIISLVDACMSPREVTVLQEAFHKELPPQALASFPITWNAKVCAWRGSREGTFTLLKDFVACMRVVQGTPLAQGLRGLELENVQVADGDLSDLGTLFPFIERLHLSSDTGCCYGASKLMEAVTSAHLQHLRGLSLNGSMEDVGDDLILSLCQAALDLRKDGSRPMRFVLFIDHRGGSRRGYELKELPLEWRKTVAALASQKHYVKPLPNVQLVTQVFETCVKDPSIWEPVKVASS